MFEKVLFATDFSGYAEKMTECMGEIPRVKEIVLLHVIDPKRFGYWEESQEILVTRAELLLKEKAELFRSAGKKVKAMVTVGIPSKEILRIADEECVSLIIIGAKGMGTLRGVLTGSASFEVLRYGKVSTLLMRYKVLEKMEGSIFEKYCERTFSRVLYPIEFPASPEKILSLIKEMPRADKVMLVHVISAEGTEKELQGRIMEAERVLKGLQDDLKAAGQDASYHVHAGYPAIEINRVAEEEDASLIVMDARGEAGEGKARITGATENVIRTTSRPVLVIK